jgi:hypothetical protein
VKIRLVSVGLLLLTAALAQQHDKSLPNGTIYGIVVGQDGKPAKATGLTAGPLGVALAAVLPHTKTNDAGEYRFQNLPWWGRYTVYPEDEDAGYSTFSGGPGHSDPAEVDLAPERRKQNSRSISLQKLVSCESA